MTNKRPGAVHISRKVLIGLDKLAELELTALTEIHGNQSELMRSLIRQEYDRVIATRFNESPAEPIEIV